MYRSALFASLLIVTLLLGGKAVSQVLNLPSRPANAPGGTNFINLITPLSLTDRENAIYAQIASGNVPNFMRTLVAVPTSAFINGAQHTATFYVTPDYLAVGADDDYFLEPMTPLLAQRIADLLNCTLPTRRMVNTIWTNAAVKLAPAPIAPSAAMITVPVFAQHNAMVATQRRAVTNAHPLGALVSGDKKDIVISTLIYNNLHANVPKPVVIYGWHQLSGSPIQPLYNGHEETYADYSHGVRLVQKTAIVDGVSQSITNILTNPGLAAIFSDEGVISTPRYTVAAPALQIATQPFSQAARMGEAASFIVTAIGNPPLRYRWRRNGIVLPGATNAALNLANIQQSQAGLYDVAISNSTGTIFSMPCRLTVSSIAYPILFQDDFETNSSSNWNLYWGAANNVADYAVDWNFNYGTNQYTFNGITYLIPPAPHSSGTTRGVRITVNNNDANGSIAGLNLYPKGKSFSGDFNLRFDMWINYPGSVGGSGTGIAGSTEHAIFGIDHIGNKVNWAATTAAATDGIWFGVDGEGGTSRDYRAYVGNPSGLQTELLGSSAGLSQSDNSAPFYVNLFPASRFETPGSPGKQWVSVDLRQAGGFISWLMDGTLVAQRTNTSAFTSGDIMIGFMDTFSSIANPARDAFVLFDNVRVENLAGAGIQPPVITSAPQNLSAAPGDTVTLSVEASGSPPLSYQWFFNGAAIDGATERQFLLQTVQAGNAGAYQVVVMNAAGSANASAVLDVVFGGARFESSTITPNGRPEFTFTGLPGSDYVLEASTNLSDWLPVTVVTATDAPLSWIDPSASNFSRRFYRAREASGQTLTDFESYPPGTPALFQMPAYSGSTSNYLNPSYASFAYVTNGFPDGNPSAQVLQVSWSFLPPTSASWLRLTTFGATNLPNPTIGITQAIEFDAYSDRDVYVCLGLRETNTSAPIGANGGASGGIEWIGGSTANTPPPKGRLIHAGEWTTLIFLAPYEPVRAFTGNGALESTSGKAVFEHLCIVPASGAGVYNLYLDNFKVIDLGR